MSVSTTTSVSSFMATYVESQNRTDATFSAAEEAQINAALAEFQISGAKLQQIGQLLDDLEVMRGLVSTQSLSPASLDAIELSIQMLLQGAALDAPSLKATTLATAEQAFSDAYLTSTYLENATVWPGADTQLQADLAQFDLSARERAVASQYMYSIADQRRYLASIDAALAAPGGVLYAAPGTPGYPAYLEYSQVRDAVAAQVDAYVATVQGLLGGSVNVADAGFDQVPWSLQFTDPQTAVPPSNPLDQAKFEINEDNLLMGQLGVQIRTMEGQVAQLTAKLAPRVQPPLTSEQTIMYSTQRADLIQELKLVHAEFTALQARVAYNTAIVAGQAMSAIGSLTADLNVDAAKGKVAAFVPRPGGIQPPLPPAPTALLQQTLMDDQAAYAALVRSPTEPPPPGALPDPYAPAAPPIPTQSLLEGYIDHLSYLLVVPSGMQLTPEQIDERSLLWAHRAALFTQMDRVNRELAALQARISYTQAVLNGTKAFEQEVWIQLSGNVTLATVAREGGETAPPTAGAITTKPPQTVAWKLSGANPARIEMTRIDNFLLDAVTEDWVYAQLDAFKQAVGLTQTDLQTLPSTRTAVLTALNELTPGTLAYTNAQRQLTALNALSTLMATYSADAMVAYDNAEAARTVTKYLEVDASLAAVEASLATVQRDDYLAAQQKMALADANFDYHYPTGNPTDPRALYVLSIYTLSVNTYNQALYAYQASQATPGSDQEATYLAALAGYQAEYTVLLTDTLARFFDAAYVSATSAATWPRTLSSSMSDAAKAEAVMTHYNGYVYPFIDPIATTILPREVS